MWPFEFIFGHLHVISSFSTAKWRLKLLVVLLSPDISIPGNSLLLAFEIGGRIPIPLDDDYGQSHRQSPVDRRGVVRSLHREMANYGRFFHVARPV